MTHLILEGSKLWQCITSNCLKHHLWGLWIKYPLCTVYISCRASLKMTIVHNMCIPLSFNYAKPTWFVVRLLVHVATRETVNYIPDSHGSLIFHSMIQRLLIGIQWSAKIGLLECEIYIHPLSVFFNHKLGEILLADRYEQHTVYEQAYTWASNTLLPLQAFLFPCHCFHQNINGPVFDILLDGPRKRPTCVKRSVWNSRSTSSIYHHWILDNFDLSILEPLVQG